MKKIILASIAMSFAMSCLADDIPTLIIKTDTKENSILLKNISKVQYTDTEMVIKLNDGSSKSFIIDDIKEMSFDSMNETTFVNSTNTKGQNGMEIFDLNGLKKRDTNQKGIYIMKSGKETKKVKK